MSPNAVRAVLALGLIVAAVAGGVATGTFATFTSQTTNPGNVASNASVAMRNVAGTAVAGSNCSTETASGTCATLFNVQNFLPGTSSQNTTTITYTGTVATGDFRLFMNNFNEFASGYNATLCTNAHPGGSVGLQIKQGTAVIYPVAGTGFGSLGDFHTSYATSGTGLRLKPGANADSGSPGAWPPANPPVTFTITLQLDTAVDNSNQGCRSSFDLDWYASQTATAGSSFGPATNIVCAATPSAINANGFDAVVVTGTLKDAAGNTVAGTIGTPITFNNNTPALLTPTAQQVATTSAGTATVTYFSSGNTSGAGQISLTSGSLTGCNAQVTINPLGPATGLAITLSPTAIAADGFSKSRLRAQIVDANGNNSFTDTTTVITASITSGAASCVIASQDNGSGTNWPNPQTAGNNGTTSAGFVNFYIQSTATPGTCGLLLTTNNGSIAGGSTTLTTVVTGAAAKLSAVTTGSPAASSCDPNPFDISFNCPFTNVFVQDTSGNRETGPAGASVPIVASWPVSSFAGQGCQTGMTAWNLQTGAQLAQTSSTNGGVTTNSVTITTTSRAAQVGRAQFTFGSMASTSGCTVTFSVPSNPSIASMNTTLVFTPGPSSGISCSFSPTPIAADGASTSIATVRLVDSFGNATNTGAASVAFARTASTAPGGATTLLTSSPRDTADGITSFTVRSTTTTGNDTYTATASGNGSPTVSSSCGVATQ